MGTKLLLLALVAGTYAVPTIRESCSTTCAGTNKFGYQPGTTYEFDYDVDTTTLLQGASEGLSGLKMSAKVQLEVLSKCDLVLKVDSVSLHERDPNSPQNFLISAVTNEFKQAIEEHPLRFSFQDGRVDSLCPSDSERSWVLNIKKGILSMVQNTMDDLTADQKVKETDVAGTCDADYTVEQNGWYSVTVKKSKNLLGCTERHSLKSALQGTPYSVSSEIQSLPIMKSSHDCQQEISKAGILKSSTCAESHIFRPFSRESSGAVTNSKQTLTYVSERSGVSNPRTVNRKTSMTYEHTDDATKTLTTRKQVEEKLVEICSSTKEDVRPETPRLFADLVTLLKTADGSTLETLYETVKRGSLCSDNNSKVSKFFTDAIPMIETSSSLRMLVKLINDNEVTGTEADMWLTTLSFIQRPTKDMLNEIKPIVTKNGNSMLAVSSLLNNYCKTTSCDMDFDVKEIVSTMENKIGYGCYVDDNNIETVVITLRALGNAGYISSALPTITTCLNRKENPMEVRVAAAEAFRRASCDIDRSEISQIFQDQKIDSELRIVAYLSLMECPSDSVITTVKTALESEEVNQVGSFVWSHLTNLMETSNPLKQDIRSILEDETLKKEFNMDNRKFSRNYEWSLFLEKLNTGASVESNMIWSSNSFIPRSVMANFTLDLFGQSINLFEVGGRIEGLEYFLETYFGPNGYFAERAVNEATKQVVKGIDTKKMNNIDNQFSSEMDKLKGALYLRMFGNDIRYSSFRGSKDILGGNGFNILELLISLSKNHDYSFTQNLMFMNSGLTIPTSAGFPVNLKVNGTSTMDFKASGKVDLRKLGTSPRSLVVTGLIRPSAAVEISSMMSVDAFVTKSGMKMVSTLHTSTQLKGAISLKDDQVFSAEWEPSDKTEILNVKSSFFTVHRETEKEQKMITANRKKKEICTGNRMAKITGLELCGELQFPNASLKADAPYFPFTGPVSLDLALFKRDSHKSYKMQTNLINNRKEMNMKVYFNTPGSKVDRQLSASMVLEKAEKTLKMNMISPWKKASYEGEIVSTKDMKKVGGIMTIDGSTTYQANAQLSRSRKGNSFIYSPLVEIIVPKMKAIILKGEVEYRPSQLLDSELTLTGISKTPIVTKVSFMNKKVIVSAKASISFEKKKEYAFETSLQTYQTKKSIRHRPFLSIRSPTRTYVAFGGSAEFKYGKALVLDFTMDQITSKPMKVLVRLRDETSKKNQKYRAKIDIRTPLLTTKIGSNFVKRGSKAVIFRSTANYVIPRVARDTVKLNAKMNFASTRSMKAVKGNLDVAFKKATHLNGRTFFNLQHNKKHSEGEFDMRYGDKKDASKRVYLQTIMNHIRISKLKKIQYDIISKALIPALGIDLQVKGEHSQSPNTVDSKLALSTGKKSSYEGSISLKDKSKKTKTYIGVAKVSYPGNDMEIKSELTQPNARKYINKLSATLGKGNSFASETIYRNVDTDEHEVSTTISLPNTKPFTLSGKCKLDSKNLQAAVQLKSRNDVYAFSSSSKYRPGAILDISTDIRYPSRRITAEIGIKNKKPLYSSRLDVKWDADKDASKRYQLRADIKYDNIDNIAVELGKSCPVGKYELNFKHNGGSQYVSHADLKWGNNKKISIDSTFKNKKGALTGSLKLKSPFQKIRSVSIEMEHSDKDTDSTSTLKVDWAPMEQISSTLTLKKPMLWSNLEGNLAIKTPFTGFEKTSLDLKHSLTNKLQSSLGMSWNRNNAQLNILAESKGQKTNDLLGRFSLQSTFTGVRSLSLAAKHTDNGNKFDNTVTFEVNGQSYSYEGETTHYWSGWHIQNNGRVMLISPTRRYETTWSHRNAGSDLRSSLKSNFNGQVVELTLNSKENMAFESGSMSLNIGIKTPSDLLKDADFSLTHEHRRGFMDTNIQFNKEKRPIMSLSNNYIRRSGQVTSAFDTNILGERKTLKTSANYASYPLTGNVELSFNGKSAASMDGKLNFVSDLIDGSLNMKSGIRYLSYIKLTINQNKERNSLVTRGMFQYENGKSITLESQYQWNRKKSSSLIVTTPFESFKRLTVGAELTGNLESFHSSGHFQLQPTIGPFSSTAQWSTFGGVLANFRIDTPFKQIPGLKISLKSDMDKENRNSDLTVEIFPAKYVKIETSIRPKIDDLEGIISIKTHSDNVPFVGAVVRHAGNMKAFVSHGEIEYAVGKKLEADVSLTNNRKVEGTVVLKSPFSEDISAVINHEGVTSDFRSSGFIQYGKVKKLDIKAAFKNGISTEGNIRVKTPLTDPLSSAFNFKNEQGEMMTHAETQYGSKKYEVDFKSNNNKKIESSLTIKSPHHDDISVNVHHSGDLKSFRSHADGQYGSKKYEGDLSYSNNDDFISSLVLKSPQFSDVSLMITHNGGLSNFATNAEVKYGREDKYATDINFKNGNKISGSFSVKVPKQKDITASFSHEGSIKKFKTSGNIQLTPKVKMNVDMSFSRGKRTVGVFSLKSPSMSNIDAQLKHSGDLKDMSSLFNLKMDKKKIVDLSVGLTSKKRIIGTMKIITTLMDDVSMKFVHKGRRTNFKLQTDMSLGKEKYAADVAFKCKPNIKVTVTAATPIKGLRKLKADFAHSGTIKSFKSQASFGSGKEKYTGNLKFTMKPNLITDISIETPVKGLKKIDALITHEGSLSNFKCHGEITKGKSKEFNADITFTAAPALSTFVSIQTPFKRFENTELSLSHQGSVRNFQSKMKLVGLKGKTIALVANADIERDFSTAVSIQTPFRGFEIISGAASHTGTWRDFVTRAELDNGSPAKYTGEVSFSMKDKISGEIQIKTPLPGKEVMRAAFSQEGTLNNFISHAEIQCVKSKTEADVTFSSIGNIEGNVMVNSPYFKPIKAVISAKSSPYNAKIAATYGRKQLINGQFKLNTNKNIKGSVSIKTWFAPEAKATLSQEGNLKNFRTQCELSYGNHKFQSDTSFDARKDITASTTLLIPSIGIDTSSATLSFSGDLTNLRARADCSVNRKTDCEIDVTFNSKGPVTGAVAIRTPFTAAREFTLSFKHNGKVTDFTSQAEYSMNGEKGNAEIVFDIDGDINMQGSIKHPMIQPISFEITHSGNKNQFKSHAQVIYKGKKQVVSDIFFSSSPSLEFSAKLNANCPAVQSAEANLSHKGTSRNFRSQSVFILNGDKTSAKLTYDSRNGIEGKLVLKTPMSGDFIASFNHNGDRQKFKSEGSLEYSGKRQYHVESTLNTLKDINGKITLQTPRDTYSTGLNHEGNLDAFKSFSHIEYGSGRRIQISANLNRIPILTGQVTLKAPFMADVIVGFSHEGTLKAFQSSGFMKYDDKEQVGANIESRLSKTEGYSGKVVLRKLGWNKIELLATHHLTSGLFTNQIACVYGSKKIESDIQASFKSPFKGSVRVKTPFDGFETSHASFTSTVSSSGFQSTFDGSLIGRNVQADMSIDTIMPMRGSVILTTNIPGIEEVRASFSHDNSRYSLVSHGEATLQQKTVSVDVRYDTRNAIEGSVVVKTPFNRFESQSISIRHTDDFSQAEANYDGKKATVEFERSRNGMKLSSTSPFIGFENQYLTYNNDRQLHRIEGNFRGRTIEIEMSAEPTKMFIKAKTPFKGFEEQQAAYNYDGINRHVEGTFRGERIEADLSIEPSKIILQTNTPFKRYENMHIIYIFDGTKRHLEVLFQGKKIELDAVVKPEKIEIVAKTPFEGYEIQHLAYTNDSSTYHIEGEFQGQKVEGDLLLTLSQKELVLKTPFTGYENMEIKYTFDGTTRHIEGLFLGKKMELGAAVKPEKIEIVAKTPFQGYEQQHLSYFKDRTTYHAEGEFQGQKVEADLLLTPSQKELVIKTPFGGFERQHVAYTNDDFSHHLEGMFKRQKIEADLSIEPSKVDLKVKTPFAGFDEQKLSVSHKLKDSSCNCKIESLFQGQTIEGTMTMSWADRIDGQFRIKSTFRNYQDQQVNFNFDKSLDTYSGHIDGIFRGQKIEADASFIKDNEIRLSLKTPFVDFEEQDILLSQRQRSNSLSSRIELTYKKEKYELDMQFKAENQLEGSISVKTPFLGYEETKAVMVHSLSGSTLRSRADLTYYRQTYSIDIAFTNDRKTEGSITIVTPLQGFENTKFSFNNKLSKYRTATHAQIEYGYNKKIEADIEGSIRNRLEGRVALKTPFEGFRLTELSALHNTRKDGFNSLANLRYGNSDKISISSDFSFRNTGIDASFAIESPFTQTASASVSSSWKSSHAEFVYGKEKVEADLNVNDDASSITFLLKTPLQGIETTTFSWNMNGQLRNMNIKTDLTYGASESISVTIKNIVQGNDIDSSFTMVSPYTDDIRIKYKQTRNANSYSQEFETAVGADNGMSQQTTLQTGNYYFDFETKTTWTVFGESQSTTATLKHNGPLENFKTEASVETNGHKSNVVLSLKTDQKIEATFTLKTPFECIKDIQARITQSGEIDQFVSSGEIQYNDMEKIQGKINFFKNKFRRLNANIEIITPFVGYEQTNFIVKHLKNNNGLRTSAVVISGRRKQISIFLKALFDPMEFELSTESPFRGYEDMSVKGKHQNGNTELILSKMQDQIAFSSIMDLSSEPMTAEVRLATPFSGFESSEIKMKTNTDISNLKSAVEIKSSSLIPITADVQVQYVTPTEMSGTFNFNSGITNMEVIKVFGSNRRNGDDITTHLETSWNRHDPIVFDGTFGVGRSSRQGGISFSTPFKMISSFDAKCNYELTDKTYKDSMIVSMNGKTLVDMDLFLNFGDNHAFQVVVREPNPIKVETELLTSSGKKSGSAMVNWNTKRDDSQVKISGEYSVDKNKKNMLVTLSNAVKSVALKGSLERSMYKTFNSLDFLSDGNSLFGYEFQDNSVRSRNNFQRANKLRLCFPSRNVELYGSYNNKYGSRSVSGSFAWDADRDDSRRVGLKAQLSPKGEATLADISFEMPSIGRDVKVDSEMTINSGSVLFDGKTELRYSKDSAKTLVIRSRIEDVSYGYRKNYTLTFGLQHQFTNVDVQLASHVGKSNGKFTTGFDVKYLTAKRQRKNLALMAEIDSIKKQMNLMMRSPMKSIQMTGSVQTTPYKMSLRNVYDNTKIINTDFSLDTHKQSVNFQMNYDSENPNNVLHLNGKYVNDSAILAEIYREENSRKIVDSLLALRLNTSRLLHTRLHWRPTILQEIKDSGVRRMTSGSQRLNAAFTDAAEAVSEELNAKYNAIRQSASEDLRPFITFIQEIMSNLNTEIKSLSSRTSSKAFTRPLITISQAMENGNNMLEDLKSVVRQDFPMKKQYDFYVEASKELLEVIEAESVKNYVKLIDFISEQLKELSEAVEKAHTSYQGMVSKLSQNQATEFLNNKYDSLRSQLSDSKISENIKNVASKYTSAIYQARDQIATRLDGPAVRKIQGMSNSAYQMASAAYKFWEVEENVKSVLDKVYEMVRNEIKEEIDSVKNAVTRLQNSRFTVFNPQGGEIQMDSYLPVPMKSLKELPTISLNKHLNRMSSYIPDVSRIPSFRDILSDSDISNWLPPFYGLAKLEGSRVTTFDGQNFEFSGGKCSYVLTRDYMDGNFSIIADYLGKGKKKMIIQTATQTIQVAPNGKLRVDSKPVKPLYHSREVTITEMNNVISVSGNGFRVDIDIPHDTVIAQVSGWYHNRLGGIFGTLNQERYDDMITPARKLTTDVDYLVNTWEVDSKCL